MLTEPKTLNIACSSGTVPVSIGEEFTDTMEKMRWQVVGWSGGRIYSPSGFGGTPCVFCKPLGELTDFWRKYQESDGTVEWCGDSVAAYVNAGRRASDMAKDNT